MYESVGKNKKVSMAKKQTTVLLKYRMSSMKSKNSNIKTAYKAIFFGSD